MNVSSVRLRLGWLIVAALGLQLAVVYLPWLQSGERYQFPAVLMILSYLMLLAGVFANGHIGGMRLLGTGLLLNLVVMVANGGFMPIAPEAASSLGKMPQGLDGEFGVRMPRSKDVILSLEQTPLWMLSDIFATSRYLPMKTVFSIGDVVSALGLFLSIQWVMLPNQGTKLRCPSRASSEAA